MRKEFKQSTHFIGTDYLCVIPCPWVTAPQCMADMLHIIHAFGGVENLKGKKAAMN